MQVHQMLVSFSFGDAISNEAIRIQRILQNRGYDSQIFAEAVDTTLAARAKSLWEYQEYSSPENVLILHFSIGAGMSKFAYELPDRMILIYHNITPAHWFASYHPHLARLCYRGRRELAAFPKRTSLALGVSEFNRAELEAAGFKPTAVLPFMRDREQLAVRPNPTVLQMFDDDKSNFLYVGRVIPPKRFEDLIKFFHIYKKRVDSNARLLLVGEWRGFERYFDALIRLVDDLSLRDVVFTGHVDTDDLVAYYQVADLFISMSEHEGFGVPLIEACHFGLPVMAFDAGAVAETLGGSGILFREKRFEEVAEMAHCLLHDSDLAERVVAAQFDRLDEMESWDEEAMLMGFVEQVTSHR